MNSFLLEMFGGIESYLNCTNYCYRMNKKTLFPVRVTLYVVSVLWWRMFNFCAGDMSSLARCLCDTADKIEYFVYIISLRADICTVSHFRRQRKLWEIMLSSSFQSGTVFVLHACV